MRIRKARKGLVPIREGGEIFQNLRRFFQDDFSRPAQDYDVRIVPYVAGGRAQVYDPRRLGALQTVGVYVTHHVVTDFLFAGFRRLEVDIVPMRHKLRDLLFGYFQAERPLRLCQRDPEAPPGGKLKLFGKNILHLPARVARGKGRNIGFFLLIHRFTRCIC